MQLAPCSDCVQDEEQVHLNCPSADLANLRVKHHQLFRFPPGSFNRLRDFISQADTKGLSLFVYECLECCAYISDHNLACLLFVSVAGLIGFSLAALLRQVKLCNLT